MEAINAAGLKIFNILVDISYWVIAIAGVGSVINCIAKKNVEGALKASITYGVAFASVFMLKWTLDLIRGIFA